MQTAPYRSMLFVPGQREGWVAKAMAAGADAIIIDLEDAVPDADKERARAIVAEQIDAIAADPPATPCDIWVRPNAWDSRLAGLDLEAVVRPGLAGLFLPKLFGPADVAAFDVLARHCEIRNGVPDGEVKLIATLETPQGMGCCEAIAAASPRMVAMVGTTARDADSQRSLGFRWSAEGEETLYLRSRVLMACRAALLPFALVALWQDISDLDGLRRFAERQRDLGYDGQLAIHPSHVETINDVFTPSAEEVAFYQGIIDAFEAAERDGRASVVYEGQHIDTAHYETAKGIVAAARR